MTAETQEGRDELTPLELDVLSKCVERGSTRTSDGTISDTILSVLCSKPKDAPYVSWRMNPNSSKDGWINLYEPTEAGRAALALARGEK